jgi:putative ATP-binding cassette transporter
MDEGLESMLYRLIRGELPAPIAVRVSHRDTVDQHHDRQLELLADGNWRLDRPATVR